LSRRLLVRSRLFDMTALMALRGDVNAMWMLLMMAGALMHAAS
jgi:hypothetical protein